jgi:hypothetical protein
VFQWSSLYRNLFTDPMGPRLAHQGSYAPDQATNAAAAVNRIAMDVNQGD